MHVSVKPPMPTADWRVETLQEQLSGLLPADQVINARFGPTLGTYLGPNALGVSLTQTGGPDPAQAS